MKKIIGYIMVVLALPILCMFIPDKTASLLDRFLAGCVLDVIVVIVMIFFGFILWLIFGDD